MWRPGGGFPPKASSGRLRGYPEGALVRTRPRGTLCGTLRAPWVGTRPQGATYRNVPETRLGPEGALRTP